MFQESMFKWVDTKPFVGPNVFVDANKRFWWKPSRPYAEEAKGEMWVIQNKSGKGITKDLSKNQALVGVHGQFAIVQVNPGDDEDKEIVFNIMKLK